MTAADHPAFVGLGRRWRPATATRPSSRPTCTSPTATRSTGSTPATGSSRSRSSCTRPRRRRSGATTTRPTSGSPPQTARNRSAILYLIDQAACPYAASTQAAAAVNDCGPLYDDFEIARGWRRDPGGNDTATDRDVEPGAAPGDDRPRPQAAGHGRRRAARACHRRRRGVVAERQRPRRPDDDPQPADHPRRRSGQRRLADLPLRLRPLRGVDHDDSLRVRIEGQSTPTLQFQTKPADDYLSARQHQLCGVCAMATSGSGAIRDDGSGGGYTS